MYLYDGNPNSNQRSADVAIDNAFELLMIQPDILTEDECIEYLVEYMLDVSGVFDAPHILPAVYEYVNFC